MQSKKISFFVFNVKELYRFLLSLNLDLDELVFIPHSQDFSIKNPILINKEKKQLDSIYFKFFNNIKNADIYIFSNVFNWRIFGIIGKLANYNKIYLIDILSYSYKKFPKNNSFKSKVITYVLRYITGIRYNVLIYPSSKYVYQFPYREYGIQRIKPMPLNSNIFRKYSYNIQTIKKPSIFFIESNYLRDRMLFNYQDRMTSVFEIIKKSNYKVYLKPHPRLGYSKFLKGYCEEILPGHIPAEFFNTDFFDAIFGVYSSALNHKARDKITCNYSLLNLLEHDSEIDFMSDFKSSEEKNNVINIKSLSHLKEILSI